VKTLLKRIWNEEQGVLTFEWILLITLLLIGVVGGISAARDAIICELGDISGAIVAVDQSFTTESCACAPGCDWGSYDDTPTNITIQRPASPPVSQ